MSERTDESCAVICQSNISSIEHTYDLLDQDIFQGKFTEIVNNRTIFDLKHVSPREDIQWDELESISHIADGGMCRVSSATFGGRQCVVKTPLPQEDRKLREDIDQSLEDEQDVLKVINHMNCIKYFGSGVTLQGEKFLVLERMDCILVDILGSKATAPSKRRRCSYTRLDTIKWALEIAEAMVYLHDQCLADAMIWHRDLKPENLGIGMDGRVKLLDLGLAVIVPRRTQSKCDRYQMSGQVGSLRYMAPEIGMNESYNEKADVYSFAMIFWEMLTQTPPYLFFQGGEAFAKAVYIDHVRPSLSKKWSPATHMLLKKCWHPDDCQRPAFREIVGVLKSMIYDETRQLIIQDHQPKASSGFRGIRGICGCALPAVLSEDEEEEMNIQLEKLDETFQKLCSSQ
eukprot:CAMPEP_0117752470 /NCGR_PEP_ID=MMETSP0947-20121206/11626_1 /TAXON_ID=44440 /ORGANISM="Chattonella subsalsa, Strain CCMP2191" /LENGTH=400 /DNA_ID=CAMNT_0005571121 /DNA_START=129 /DNA_END=1331 /DNA_ORIENTATION=+